jgi:DNA-binding MarR family transcriptional regulator
MTGQRNDGPAAPAKPAARADAEDVARRLRRSMMRLTRTLRQYDTDDLTPTLASSLFTIAREGPLTLGELARSERMTNPSITAVVEKLTRQDLIERRPDPDDRRVVRVAVTTTGRRRVDARRTQRTAWLTVRLQQLDPADLKRLSRAADLLERMAEDPEVDR